MLLTDIEGVTLNDGVFHTDNDGVADGLGEGQLADTLIIVTV